MTPRSVSADDVMIDRHTGRLVTREQPTTAHLAIARFYGSIPRRAPVPLVDRIAAAPSEFCIDGLLADFNREAVADTRTRARIARAAHVRRCQLRGVLPCCDLAEPTWA